MSVTRQHYSDEILNAYIDGELSPEDSALITEAMDDDDLLRRRVTDLNRISDLVRAAFSEDVDPLHRIDPPLRRSPPGTLWRVAAVLAFVALGGMLGWHMIDHHLGTDMPQKLLAGQAPFLEKSTGPSYRDVVNDDTMKVMFHIGRKDMALFEKVLTEVDRLLSVEDVDQPILIRVIASHGGLSLFGIDSARNAEWVRNLKLKFADRVAFVGCGETFDQWRKARLEKDLLPEMVMVDSGVRELLRSQKQGWTFVSI